MLLLRPKERYPVEQAEPRDYFSAADLEKAVRFRSGQLRLYAARSALDLAILAAAVRFAPHAGKRPGRHRGRDRRGRSRPRARVATLPLRAASRQRAKNVGLITQSWGGWAVDVAKGTAIGSVFAAAGGAALAFGERRFGRAWWAPGALVISGFGVVFTYLGPVVLDPIFNKFTPLPAGDTRSDVLDLAERAGVDVGEVYSVDASRRTTAANAYVTGIGGTKRVVLYDTLLKRLHAGRDPARRRPRARPRALSRRAARAAVGLAGGAVRHARDRPRRARR